MPMTPRKEQEKREEPPRRGERDIERKDPREMNPDERNREHKRRAKQGER